MLKELREKRGRIVTEMRGMLDAAQTAKRELTAEEQTKYDALFAQQDGMRLQIERGERQANLDREMAETAANETRTTPANPASPRGTAEYRTAFANYLRGGDRSLTSVDLRALEATGHAAGGYLVAPEQFVDTLIKFVDDQVFIRAKATKYRVAQAEKMGVPTLDADPADADWTTELAVGGEDSTMAFGKREFAPHPIAKLLKVSKKLLRASAMPVEQIVLERLGYKFGITQEKAFLTGNGADKPLGLFTASSDGISTARDVSTGNTSTAIGFDGLIEAKYSVKGAYWPKAEWIFHRDALKQISKLKDGDGAYLWRQAVKDGDPDTVLGRPVNMSEYAPNTFTSGLYVGIFGDLSQYWICDALDMQVQRLVELYAAANQDGFIGRMESDGMPVLAEAFARVKLA